MVGEGGEDSVSQSEAIQILMELEEVEVSFMMGPLSMVTMKVDVEVMGNEILVEAYRVDVEVMGILVVQVKMVEEVVVEQGDLSFQAEEESEGLHLWAAAAAAAVPPEQMTVVWEALVS